MSPRKHEIPALAENMIWGYIDSTTPPVLRVASGDVVTVHSFPAGGPETVPPDGSGVSAEHRKALDTLERGPGPHFITGPVYVEGAAPGDVLQIDILDVTVNLDWGFLEIIPLKGALPEDFPDYQIIHPRIDRERGLCVMPWGTELPLEPFFGVIATAPPPAWGRCPSPVPRSFGGNLDNKELRTGTTLYLPVFNEGALFYAGDGHGLQGDGEVCISALETGVSGTFRLTVRKDLALTRPFAEDADHLISIGLDEDLDDAAKEALRDMIDQVCARSRLSRNEAYMLLSLVGDLRVTQLVNGNKGVHMLLDKAYLPASDI